MTTKDNFSKCSSSVYRWLEWQPEGFWFWWVDVFSVCSLVCVCVYSQNVISPSGINKLCFFNSSLIVPSIGNKVNFSKRGLKKIKKEKNPFCVLDTIIIRHSYFTDQSEYWAEHNPEYGSGSAYLHQSVAYMDPCLLWSPLLNDSGNENPLKGFKAL